MFIDNDLPGEAPVCSGPVSAGAEHWGALDHFARDLARCPGPAAATRRFLQAARAILGADLVYGCSLSDDGPVEVAGVSAPPPWCRAVARAAVAAAPGTRSQLLRPRWEAPRGLGCPSPCSLAMVRLSRSRSAWAVALRFDVTTGFRPPDMAQLVLARQMLASAHQHYQTQGQLRDVVLGLIQGVITAVDARDHYFVGHSERVARIAVRLGEQMGLPAADLGDLYLVGLLHDLGRVGMRDATLDKPGPLTPDEMAHVRDHPALSAAIVSRVAAIAHLVPLVRAHHERWDGKGYPDGLAGEAIPLLARVLAVADGFDALLADRPYRAALPPPQVEATLRAGAGSQWDERIVRDLLTCRDDVAALAPCPGPQRRAR